MKIAKLISPLPTNVQLCAIFLSFNKIYTASFRLLLRACVEFSDFNGYHFQQCNFKLTFNKILIYRVEELILAVLTCFIRIGTTEQIFLSLDNKVELFFFFCWFSKIMVRDLFWPHPKSLPTKRQERKESWEVTRIIRKTTSGNNKWGPFFKYMECSTLV